jgi:conserved protein with predicted RNA binding PUA domain
LSSAADLRRLSIIVDYLFGNGVSSALPKGGFRLVYSRKSGRLKLVFHEGRPFATIRPNGAMALSVYAATLLAKSRAFSANYVRVEEEAVPFVVGGKSVFCKFVRSAGENVYPRSEVAVVDPDGKVLGVGTAVLNGRHMAGFKSGVAVKVRDGLRK